MRRTAALAAAITLLVTAVAAPASAAPTTRSDGYRKVGYFTQWGIYGRAFPVKKLDTSGAAARLTHVNYAFGNVSQDGRCFETNPPGEGDAWADYQWPVPAEESVDGVADAWGEPLNGNFGQLRKLKAKHPDLKVLMSLGGWTWSTYFSNAALTEASRRAFVSSCIDLFLKGDLPLLDGPDGSGGPGAAAGVFDGFDIDWEWPGSAGDVGNVIRPEDKQNFTKLVAEFRRQLDAYGRTNGKHYELTAFLPANPATMDAGFEGDQIFRYLDFATVQGYDFHGPWELRANQQSALRVPAGAPDNPDFSAEVAIGAWRDRGAPARELVLGIPYYGHGWTGVTGGRNGLFGAATGAARATWEPGSEDYKVLKTKLDQGYTLYRDVRAGHAWLYDGNTFWTYDDPAVVLQKALWIRAQGLGGAMVWSVDGDDDNATLTRTIALGLWTP
jgi:chitinase